MLNVVTYNLTNTVGVNMKPLEKKLILGADGKTMVYVYYGDVNGDIKFKKWVLVDY